ncbi:hypothetical protein [Edaphobacter albus]|uniref:hypothetical protein n=1 Tax=Edaphobacter sp. 4G125 TaxID=2763071 RepID=UPI0016484941|nr:hypothetical protein [Edaphobacter sp. 4G125]QNI36733.1 hypothetical protein H7846_17625 [Edaphobacter sp. 4G125]
MFTVPSGKYQLKSLHEEIALFDRKLAHLQKYEAFATEAERGTAAGKLSAKRNLLVRKAQQMIDEGIEFDEVERPKSLREESDGETTGEASISAAESATWSVVALRSSSEPSPYLGTSLDSEHGLQAYKKNKAKRKTA